VKDKIRELTELSQELTTLSRELTDYLKHPAEGGESSIARGESLLRRVMEYRHDLSRPDGRLLRLFFEASGLSEALDTARDLYLASSNRVIGRSLDQNLDQVAVIGRSLDQNLDYVAYVQNAIEWIEVFLVSIYVVELGHILAGKEVFDFETRYSGFGLLALAVFTAFVMAIGLHPWHREHAAGRVDAHPEVKPKPTGSTTDFLRKYRLAFALGGVAIAFAVFLILGHVLRPPEGSGHPTSDTAPTGHQVNAKETAKEPVKAPDASKPGPVSPEDRRSPEEPERPPDGPRPAPAPTKDQRAAEGPANQPGKAANGPRPAPAPSKDQRTAKDQRAAEGPVKEPKRPPDGPRPGPTPTKDQRPVKEAVNQPGKAPDSPKPAPAPSKVQPPPTPAAKGSREDPESRKSIPASPESDVKKEE
jgi:hypothetical protein